MQESNGPEDDFLLFGSGKFYLSCLVTSVGKHPGAVLLLSAQQSILVTFNESRPQTPTLPSMEQRCRTLLLWCTAPSTSGHT